MSPMEDANVGLRAGTLNEGTRGQSSRVFVFLAGTVRIPLPVGIVTSAISIKVYWSAPILEDVF